MRHHYPQKDYRTDGDKRKEFIKHFKEGFIEGIGITIIIVNFFIPLLIAFVCDNLMFLLLYIITIPIICGMSNCF